jgi:hypothetical protein
VRTGIIAALTAWYCGEDGSNRRGSLPLPGLAMLKRWLGWQGTGGWCTERAETDDASCDTRLMGTVVKLGGDNRDPSAPLLTSPPFFNNSLRTRSPLFRGFPGPAIISHNYAVTFVGCDTEGAVFCRQYPIAESSCVDRDFWTKDRQHSLPTVSASPTPLGRSCRIG